MPMLGEIRGAPQTSDPSSQAEGVSRRCAVDWLLRATFACAGNSGTVSLADKCPAEVQSNIRQGLVAAPKGAGKRSFGKS